MPKRRVSKHLRPARPLLDGMQTSARKADGLWVMRSVSAARAVKQYICPGCNQSIPPGQAHVVAWPHTPPIGSSSGLDHRRHWHSSCWARKP